MAGRRGLRTARHQVGAGQGHVDPLEVNRSGRWELEEKRNHKKPQINYKYLLNTYFFSPLSTFDAFFYLNLMMYYPSTSYTCIKDSSERVSDLPKDAQLLCEEVRTQVKIKGEELLNEQQGVAYLESLGGCAQGPHRG